MVSLKSTSVLFIFVPVHFDPSSLLYALISHFRDDSLEVYLTVVPDITPKYRGDKGVHFSSVLLVSLLVPI